MGNATGRMPTRGIQNPIPTKVVIQEGTPIDSIKANSSLSISNTDSVVASSKTVTKTLNGISYQKTLSYNAAGDFLTSTVWSQV